MSFINSVNNSDFFLRIENKLKFIVFILIFRRFRSKEKSGFKSHFSKISRLFMIYLDENKKQRKKKRRRLKPDKFIIFDQYNIRVYLYIEFQFLLFSFF